MEPKNIKQNSYLSRHTRVSPNSQQWSSIEYELQTVLASSTAVCRNIWSITNANVNQNFQKKNNASNQVILESWLDTSTLDNNNTPEKICQGGFEFPPGGVIFPTGQIKLDQGRYTSRKNKVYELIVFRVAVGRSYSLPAQKRDMIKEKKNLPPGFDSVYLLYDHEDEESQVFTHDYVIFDNTQVLPLYVVHFEFDPKKEEDLSDPICDLCQETQAVKYCKAEDANLCHHCDEEHHSKTGKLVSKHQRVPISERPKQFGKCSQHPEYTLEFYCPTDNEPLCVYCKINGSHAVGEKVNHTVVKISDAYSKALNESKEKDPILEKRKSQLTDLLNNIDIRMKEVNVNATEVEENIYVILQEALKMLQAETQKKLSFLIADQIEIKRQQEQIVWMQSFLRYQRDILSPADYLNAWSRYLLKKNDLINLNPLPVTTDVLPDMRVEGRITVLSNKIRNPHDESFSQMENQDGSEEMSPGTGASRFRSSILKKGGKARDALVGSALKDGYLKMKNIIPMAADKITVPQNYDIYRRDGPKREDDSGIFLNDEISKLPQFTKKKALLGESPMVLGLAQNKPMPGQHAENSLRAEAKKKLGMLKNTAIWGKQTETLLKDQFKDSQILENDEGERLYLNLPFSVDKKLPKVQLIFYRYEQSPEEADITSLFKNNEFANIFIFKLGDEKFGAYASHPWIYKKNDSFGDSTCFLFNLNKDIKLLPTTAGPLNQSYFSCGFGSSDLQISYDFQDCESTVEATYMSGLKLDEKDKKSLLAGSDVFVPDFVEIYAIKYTGNDY